MQNLLSHIISPGLQLALFPIRAIFFTLTILSALYIIYFLFRSPWFKLIWLYNIGEFLTMKTFHSIEIAHVWKKIFTHRDSLDEHDLRKAITKVGELFEKIIARLAPFSHLNTTAERLNYLATTLSGVENFRRAHDIYLALRSGEIKELSVEDGNAILAAYEQAFRDLHVIK